MGKKSDLQDELVRYCIGRDGPGKGSYIFTNDEVKEISMSIGFRNHNDATHIDTREKVSPLMEREGFGILHLGTSGGVGKVARHAFIRDVDALFHDFEEIGPEDIIKMSYTPERLDNLNSSESNILSIVFNHGLLGDFLYPAERRAIPNIYMAHRTRVRPEYRVDSVDIPADLIQIEVDMTLEYNGVVTIFEGKNWMKGRNNFAVYQIYLPYRYYQLKSEQGEIETEEIQCCYIVRRAVDGGSDIDAYLYTFEEPDNMASIKLVKAKRFELR
jgi:hypothetical protein|tara:strand:+ start:157 stop:972 length:816 start_codon:yes stop_codon:yes gene_type:complete